MSLGQVLKQRFPLIEPTLCNQCHGHCAFSGIWANLIGQNDLQVYGLWTAVTGETTLSALVRKNVDLS